MRRRDWGNMGWRRDHFTSMGKLEGEVKLSFNTRECFQVKTCMAALLPKVCHVGELMLGKGLGSGGPRSLEGHGR